MNGSRVGELSRHDENNVGPWIRDGVPSCDLGSSRNNHDDVKPSAVFGAPPPAVKPPKTTQKTRGYPSIPPVRTFTAKCAFTSRKSPPLIIILCFVRTHTHTLTNARTHTHRTFAFRSSPCYSTCYNNIIVVRTKTTYTPSVAVVLSSFRA